MDGWKRREQRWSEIRTIWTAFGLENDVKTDVYDDLNSRQLGPCFELSSEPKNDVKTDVFDVKTDVFDADFDSMHLGCRNSDVLA